MAFTRRGCSSGEKLWLAGGSRQSHEVRHGHPGAEPHTPLARRTLIKPASATFGTLAGVSALRSTLIAPPVVAVELATPFAWPVANSAGHKAEGIPVSAKGVASPPDTRTSSTARDGANCSHVISYHGYVRFSLWSLS